MADSLQIADFLARAGSIPVIDVRSPSEFRQGHIPGAKNIPLFDDRERKEVGTAYKQVNREAAIYTGLEHAGNKLAGLAKAGERAAGPGKKLLVHCWRGGMRSKSMAWLFELTGIECFLLEGGYKSFRRHVLESFDSALDLTVLGGCTGSGKTGVLAELEKLGNQVVDLEHLANHKGSAFGALGEDPQPTTEQFENNLYRRISGLDPDKPVWIEDESRNVGKCVIPLGLYEQMKKARIFFLDIPREARARYLVGSYAGHDPDSLKACVLKISKKLGGDRTREAGLAIDRSDFYRTAMITLQYYDKAYRFSLEKNHTQYEVVKFDKVEPSSAARKLMQLTDDKG